MSFLSDYADRFWEYVRAYRNTLFAKPDLNMKLALQIPMTIPDTRTSMKLTSGVEMEFSLFEDQEAIREQHKRYLRDTKALMAGYLTANGYPTLQHLNNNKYLRLIKDSEYHNTEPHPYINTYATKSDYSKWNIHHESFYHPPAYPHYLGYEHEPFELVSRVLRCDDPDYTKEVQTVQELLHKKFVILAHDVCGLHVHMGRPNMRFDVTFLRKFILFINFFEPQIYGLSSPFRVGNQYCQSPASDGNVSSRCTSREGTVLAMMHASDPQAYGNFAVKLEQAILLGGSSAGHRYSTFNFSLLHSKDEKDIGTIEVRGHEGSVEKEEITAWMGFVAHMFDWRHRSIFDFGTNEFMRRIDTPDWIYSEFAWREKAGYFHHNLTLVNGAYLTETRPQSTEYLIKMGQTFAKWASRPRRKFKFERWNDDVPPEQLGPPKEPEEVEKESEDDEDDTKNIAEAKPRPDSSRRSAIDW